MVSCCCCSCAMILSSISVPRTALGLGRIFSVASRTASGSGGRGAVRRTASGGGRGGAVGRTSSVRGGRAVGRTASALGRRRWRRLQRECLVESRDGTRRFVLLFGFARLLHGRKRASQFICTFPTGRVDDDRRCWIAVFLCTSRLARTGSVRLTFGHGTLVIIHGRVLGRFRFAASRRHGLKGALRYLLGQTTAASLRRRW